MKIFITNLPFTADEEDLKNFLETYCPVNSLSLARNAADNKSRGFAFADVAITDIAELQGLPFNKKIFVLPRLLKKTSTAGRTRHWKRGKENASSATMRRHQIDHT